jgi:hypothetical protein
LTTRETVAVETPAISATSRIVDRCADRAPFSAVAVAPVAMCKRYMRTVVLSKEQIHETCG